VCTDHSYDILEGLCYNEGAHPVEGGRDARGGAADLGRQDLTHHQPRNRPEA